MKWSTTFAIILLVLTSGIIFTPSPLIEDGSAKLNQESKSGEISLNKNLFVSTLCTIHLIAFASAFGTSLWVTFIGGIIMFRNLPRHQFGRLQGKLFPAYFLLVSLASALCLSIFSILHPLQSAMPSHRIQFFALSTTLLFSLLNIAVLEPRTSMVMKERHKVEKEEGIGNEVGLSKNEEVAKKSERLKKLNRKFGMYHGLASLANLLSLGGIVVHLCYLGARINL